MSNNTLFLILGPSGVGKTSLMRACMNNEVISFTTRPKRGKEVHGVDYLFISKDEFNDLLRNNGLMEESKYPGEDGYNYYGVTREEFETKLSKSSAFNIVNFDGTQQFKEKYNDCTTIFVHCKKEEAERRMIRRGETDAFIQKRLTTFDAELVNKQFCDYVVENPDGKLETTIEIVKAIIRSRS